MLTHDPSNKQAEAELTKARKRVLDERGFAPAEKPRRKMVRRGHSRGTRGVLHNTQAVLKVPSTDTQGVHAGGPQRTLKGFMRVSLNGHSRGSCGLCKRDSRPMGTQQPAGFTVSLMFAHSSSSVT